MKAGVRGKEADRSFISVDKPDLGSNGHNSADSVCIV